MKIKIEFMSWAQKEPLEFEADNIKDAVEAAVKNGANLYGANLYGANLRGANLYGANLYGANLECANLRGANLECANLECANLEYANLRGANLYGANLECANLECANLYGAKLRGANLRGAKHNKKELWNLRPILQLGPCGSVGRETIIYFYTDKSEPFIQCGCFRGNIAEFEAIIHKNHAGTFFEYEYMTMVEYIKSIYKYQLEGKN